jgi:GT2 family glycosyltransferase
MELIVADGMSTDSTREILREIAAQESRLRIIDNPARIMASGFNAALTSAQGEIIVMMGGHTEIPVDYVLTCVRAHQQNLAECVGGPIHTLPENKKAEAISLALSSRFGVGPVSFRVGCVEPKYVDTVAFGAYSRKIIDQVGTLDEELVRNQDDEFNYRLRKHGARILLIPHIKARYSSRATLRSLWSQYFQYGYWKVRVLQKHPRQMQPRQFIPGLFVATFTLSLLACLFSADMKWGFPVLVTTYLMASLVASLQIALTTEQWRLVLLLPLVFTTIHFAYGIGFLVGLVRFCNRW